MLFVCNWAKDKKTSWSGTHNGIYTALQKYFSITNIDIGYHNGDLYNFFYFLQKAFRKILKLKNDGEINRLAHYNKTINHKFKNISNLPAIQFEECPHQKNIQSYFYQDLSVSAVKHLYENYKDLFQISGFQNIPYNTIVKRTEIQNISYRDCAGIFCMGEWFRNFLVNNGIPENKVYAVGAGINLDKDKIDLTHKEGNKILFVGRDFNRKNGPLVLRAFKKAQAIRPGIELYIAGPAKRDDISGVHWLGDVPSSDLAYYFNLCDIFCMPSRFEAYGIVFIEALTYGLPCIGRDAFEMPFFIDEGKTGYLLKHEDDSELSELLLKLLDNNEIKNNVFSKREEYLNKYSWDAVANRMAHIIYSDSKSNWE